MLDILKSIIDLIYQFIDGIFFLRVDITTGVSVPIGLLAVALVFFFGSIYLVLKAVGIVGGDE